MWRDATGSSQTLGCVLRPWDSRPGSQLSQEVWAVWSPCVESTGGWIVCRQRGQGALWSGWSARVASHSVSPLVSGGQIACPWQILAFQRIFTSCGWDTVDIIKGIPTGWKIPASRKRIIIFATETEPILVEFSCLYHHVTTQVLGTAKPLSHHFLSHIPTVFYSQNSFVIVSSEKNKTWKKSSVSETQNTLKTGKRAR